MKSYNNTFGISCKNAFISIRYWTIAIIIILWWCTPLIVFAADTRIDSDHDGLSDTWEEKLGTDLNNPDTDGDGYKDGEEVAHGYSPLIPQPVKKDKRIEVSLKDQKLAYYFDNKKLEEFPISSGIRSMPTPTGDYTILKKKPIVHYKGPGYDLPNTEWNLMFKKGTILNYYIHGAYWHNNFGKPMSHGCVNVAYKNMEMLYNWVETGTPVSIISSTLTKPLASGTIP